MNYEDLSSSNGTTHQLLASSPCKTGLPLRCPVVFMAVWLILLAVVAYIPVPGAIRFHATAASSQGLTPYIPKFLRHQAASLLRLSSDSSTVRAEPPIHSLSWGHAAATTDASAALEAYATAWSSPESELLTELRNATAEAYPALAARMLSSSLQGRILKMLANVAGAKHILELGTFTGYSALCLAEALPADGFVITVDNDARALRFAAPFFARSPHGPKIQSILGKASDVLQDMTSKGQRFDFVFVDADKRKYLEYYEWLLGSGVQPGLLSPGGVLVVDNVLWKGLVLAHDPALQPFAPDPAAFGDPKRMAAIAEDLHRFNRHVRADPRVEAVICPLRDGFTIVRRKRTS